MEKYAEMTREELLQELARRDQLAGTGQRRLEEHYRELLSGVKLAFAELEVIPAQSGAHYDFRYLHVNRQFEEETGLAAAEVLGKTIRQALPGVDEWWLDTFGSVSCSGQPLSFVSYGNRTRRTYEVYVSPHGDRGLSVIFKNISERRGIEEALVQSKKELELATEVLEQKVAERTADLAAAVKAQESFSYAVSHDLRAPLLHMNSFTTILREEFGPSLPEEAQEYLDRVIAASGRMGTLIDNLLELSRAGKGKVKTDPVDLSEMARSTLQMLKETYPDRQVEQLVERDIVVPGDGALLRQLMDNLLGNAWKYTAKKPRSCIQFGSTSMHGETVYFVRDNGAGFDMKYRHKLFRAFERLHGIEFDGVGIGLATSQRVVQRHGGAIWAEARVDEGATFYFTLPGLGNRTALGSQKTFAYSI